VRYRLDGDRLENETVLAAGIAKEAFHDGGRLHFGPNGFLSFSSGDAGREGSAQNPRSLNGKILRLAPRQYRGVADARRSSRSGTATPKGLPGDPAANG
jgi:glucose/arabinose dehydrogenase